MLLEWSSFRKDPVKYQVQSVMSSLASTINNKPDRSTEFRMPLLVTFVRVNNDYILDNSFIKKITTT